MGTVVRITVDSPDDPVAAIRDAFARIAEIDRRLSDYKPDSEVNRLCRRRSILASDDLLRVLRASLDIAAESAGAFDVTLGPVIRLWREARRTRRLPEPAALIEAADRTGLANVQVRGREIALLIPGMQLDFGGIAKGYAAGEALNILRTRGFPRSLVAASGDLALGDPPDGEPGWRVEIRQFDDRRVLMEKNCGISTSGDTEQFVEIDGHRYSHIIDPHTLQPVAERLSVTVIAPEPILADALDTTLYVMPEAGRPALLGKHPDARAEIRRL